MTWKYKAVFVHGDLLSGLSIKIWEDEMNIHGADGWEAFVVQAVDQPNPGRWVYFKRAK